MVGYVIVCFNMKKLWMDNVVQSSFIHNCFTLNRMKTCHTIWESLRVALPCGAIKILKVKLWPKIQLCTAERKQIAYLTNSDTLMTVFLLHFLLNHRKWGGVGALGFSKFIHLLKIALFYFHFQTAITSSLKIFWKNQGHH